MLGQLAEGFDVDAGHSGVGGRFEVEHFDGGVAAQELFDLIELLEVAHQGFYAQRAHDFEQQFGGAAVEIALGEDFVARLEAAHHQGRDGRHAGADQQAAGCHIEPVGLQMSDLFGYCFYGWIAVTAIDMAFFFPLKDVNSLIDAFEFKGGGRINGELMGAGSTFIF